MISTDRKIRSKSKSYQSRSSITSWFKWWKI